MPITTRAQQDPVSLEKIAAEIDGMAQSLRIAKADMERSGIPVIEVGSYSSVLRGLERLEGFVSAVRRALKQTKESRGDFRAGEPDKPANETGQTSKKRTT